MTIRFLLSMFLILALQACAGGGIPFDQNSFTRKYDLPSPQPQSFQICYTGGCLRKAEISISKKQWSSIVAPLKKSTNAKTERKNIAGAIAKLETISGKQSPTHNDKGQNAFSGAGQMDCVDESINTSQYLIMLQDAKALKYHEVLLPTMRSMVFFGLHRTAQIRNKKTGEIFAVDSWFEDNGKKPYVVPIDTWMANWHPGDAL